MASVLTALINLVGGLTILVVQLGGRALFGLAGATAAVVVAVWRERQSRTKQQRRRRRNRRRRRIA